VSRVYEFLFRSTGSDYSVVKVDGHGNTRRSAEQSARRRLRDDHKKDPAKFYTAKVAFKGRA
jgi:hypothetical protein